MCRNLLILLLLIESSASYGQYSCSTNGNTVTITNYYGPGGVVTIPSHIGGHLVVGIGMGAFYGCASLDSVSIPFGVTTIDDYAFLFCNALTNVTILGGVTNIGNDTFQECNSLTSFTIPGSVTSIGEFAFAESALVSIAIPGSVTSFGPLAFQFCTNLGSATIGNGVTDIGGNAFNDCTSLTNVTISPSVTIIEYSVFSGCSLLTNVMIPNGVAIIGNYAFAGSGLTGITIPSSVTNLGYDVFGTGSLTAINVDPQNPAFSSLNGVLFDKTKTTIYEYPLGAVATSYTIPNTVTNIEPEAFVDEQTLTSIFFTGNAPTPGASAFQGVSTNLTAYYLHGTTGWSSTFGGLPAVLWNPLIQASGSSFGIQSNQFGFNITGTTNIPIVVEACTNLVNPVWFPLQSLTLTNGLFYFSEPKQTNISGRFYRITAP